MQMNGLNELITIAKYWKEWRDPRLVVMVLNNGDLNMVTWEQRVMEGDPKFATSQDLPPFPYAEYARSLGLGGVKVDDPSRLAAAWDQALAADRPFLLEAVTDPDVPPLPPHITLKQAKGLMTAMLRGDPSRWGVLKQALKETFP
jgi:pyruvate dehydrogenase (quinone)